MDGKRRGVLRDVRGQGLSVNAIILIILGITVLVVLILGFTIGWGRILPFVKTNNVQNVVTACDTACTTGAQFDYCQTLRNVNDGINDEFPATCNNLANSEDYKDRNYGVNKCPSLASLCSA
ncbi:MAG: hypothetical protein KKC19_01490 [Nanoarchaeota archaeon]|nr:hypothetical protein [Nanoarchaeota archaeon]